MSTHESNYFYSHHENMNNYFTTINNYISTVNNSIYYLNRSNDIISNMYNNMDYYYYYSNNYNNNPNYVPIENNRRRRVYNQEQNFENNNEQVNNIRANNEQVNNIGANNEQVNYIGANNEQVNYPENTVENQETIEEREQRINNYYRELSRENLINTIARSITKLKYRDVPNPNDTMCAITQEEFEPDDDVGIIDNCGHIFKYDSLLNWLISHQTCPNCRHSILRDSNLIRYTDTETNERMYLTNSQFRRHVLRRIFGNFSNRNSDGSSNVLSVSFI